MWRCLLITFTLLLAHGVIGAVAFPKGAQHDFGLLYPTALSEFSFEVKADVADLVIKQVRTNCGCFKVIDFPKQLAVGEVGRVTVAVDAYELKGPFSKLIFLITNQQIARYAVRGRIKPLVKFSGGSKLELKPQSKNEATSFSKTFIKTTSDTLELGEPKWVGEAKSIGDLQLTFDNATKQYTLSGSWISKADDTKSGLIEIPVLVPKDAGMIQIPVTVSDSK